MSIRGMAADVARVLLPGSVRLGKLNEKKSGVTEHNRRYKAGEIPVSPVFIVEQKLTPVWYIRQQLAAHKKESRDFKKGWKTAEASRRKQERVNAGAAKILSLVTRVTETELP